ncbi:hypothetical protein QBC44DRAFT_355683 [Cladorrhinum sp. PSN332]|nr:hypothetical protein QBC44DRAFT_355683 [Cladorrhinum sp. PSN332]
MSLTTFWMYAQEEPKRARRTRYSDIIWKTATNRRQTTSMDAELEGGTTGTAAARRTRASFDMHKRLGEGECSTQAFFQTDFLPTDHHHKAHLSSARGREKAQERRVQFLGCTASTEGCRCCRRDWVDQTSGSRRLEDAPVRVGQQWPWPSIPKVHFQSSGMPQSCRCSHTQHPQLPPKEASLAGVLTSSEVNPVRRACSPMISEFWRLRQGGHGLWTTQVVWGDAVMCCNSSASGDGDDEGVEETIIQAYPILDPASGENGKLKKSGCDRPLLEDSMGKETPARQLIVLRVWCEVRSASSACRVVIIINHHHQSSSSFPTPASPQADRQTESAAPKSWKDLMDGGVITLHFQETVDKNGKEREKRPAGRKGHWGARGVVGGEGWAVGRRP